MYLQANRVTLNELNFADDYFMITANCFELAFRCGFSIIVKRGHESVSSIELDRLSEILQLKMVSAIKNKVTASCDLACTVISISFSLFYCITTVHIEITTSLAVLGAGRHSTGRRRTICDFSRNVS